MTLGPWSTWGGTNYQESHKTLQMIVKRCSTKLPWHTNNGLAVLETHRMAKKKMMEIESCRSLEYPWQNFISSPIKMVLSWFPQSIYRPRQESRKGALYLESTALWPRAGNIIQFNKIGNILAGQSYELAWILHNAAMALRRSSHRDQLWFEICTVKRQSRGLPQILPREYIGVTSARAKSSVFH